MSRNRTRRNRRPTLLLTDSFQLELLELRTFLSSASQMTVAPLATSSSSISGYTPSQIAAAYGFDQIKGDGTGQTIAIVDAYNNPNVASDLKTFSDQFGLDDPSLKVVSQTGGSVSSIKSDEGWASEISLDVQWAHAMAPGADILLVEANSASLTDLLQAVDYARNADGVSVVSMSWGTNEFFGQTSYDSVFTTPSGHQGVTFVAASGDDGARFGPSWPSSSGNVLAVGGTTLRVDDSGAIVSESAWGGSTGGTSRFETAPSYQSNASRSMRRTAPDVSYNANPNTGFAVYDSFGSGGWTTVGGTSAGAPQWAALIALANQVRADNGEGTLTGVGTLSSLYSMYADASTYAASFNDVTTGAAVGGGRFGGFGGRFGGRSGATAASTGYDAVTGLGTPNADAVVAALSGVKAATTKATRAAATQTASTKTAKAATVATTNLTTPVAQETVGSIRSIASVEFSNAPMRAAANTVAKSFIGATRIAGFAGLTNLASLSPRPGLESTRMTSPLFSLRPAASAANSILDSMRASTRFDNAAFETASSGVSATAYRMAGLLSPSTIVGGESMSTASKFVGSTRKAIWFSAALGTVAAAYAAIARRNAKSSKQQVAYEAVEMDELDRQATRDRGL